MHPLHQADDLQLKRLQRHAHQVSSKEPNFVWSTMGKDVKLSEWTIHAVSLLERDNYYAFEDRTYSQIVVKIAIQRVEAYYLSKILLFISMIVVMSWAGFDSFDSHHYFSMSSS